MTIYVIVSRYCFDVLIAFFRADRMSVQFGSGEFVTAIDFTGFTWTRCPPIAHLQQAIVLLRMHYPYRLAGIYILNAGGAFNFIWNIVKPLLPRKALQKTVMVSAAESARLLDHLIGQQNLDEAYGGAQKGVNSKNVSDYFAAGFWAQQKQKQQRQ